MGYFPTPIRLTGSASLFPPCLTLSLYYIYRQSQGVSSIFFQFFVFRRKSLIHKDLRRRSRPRRPKPLPVKDLGLSRGKITIPAIFPQLFHHEPQTLARILRGERKGTRCRMGL